MRRLALEDFGGGMWTELDAPAGYVLNAEQAVVDGSDLRLRGAIAYRGTEAAHPWYGLAAADLAGGPRVVAWDLTDIKALSADGSAFTAVGTATEAVTRFSRASVFGEALILRSAGSPNLWIYAGSRKAPVGATITVAAKTTAVTGSGTTFLADVDPGMLLDDSDGLSVSVVKSVESDTALTLTRPRGKGLSSAPVTFKSLMSLNPSQTTSLHHLSGTAFSACAVASNKLLLAVGSRVWVSRADRYTFANNEYHDPGSVVLGVEEYGPAALVFAKHGVYAIENIALDLTDDAGNPQQQLRLLSPNVVLWNDSGVASWEGRVVVPALDDVYLFSPGEPPAPISRPIRSLYRSYVAAGYRPGVAEVFNGHYFLPIMNSTGTVIEDVLVCRLDQPGRNGLRPAWTRWPLIAAGMFALEPAPAGFGGSRLLGTMTSGGSRLLDLSATLSSTGDATDADGTTPDLDVTTNDLATGPGNRNTVLRLRARYEMTGSSVVKASLLVGPASGFVETVLAPDGGLADGESMTSWRFVKRTERLRVRLRSSGGAAKLRLRTLELFVRDSNRP